MKEVKAQAIPFARSLIKFEIHEWSLLQNEARLVPGKFAGIYVNYKSL